MIENRPPSRILHSHEDRSVNFVWDLDDGALEARFVRRDDNYFIVYLSSQSGCTQACRFCHLTATGQTGFTQATLEDFMVQARAVLNYYDDEVSSGRQATATKVHFNWMARGEPLLNPVVTTTPGALYAALAEEAEARSLTPAFKISTIIPAGTSATSLRAVMADQRATLYYSLYSMDPAFRRRWLPKAQAPDVALDMLAAIQRDTNAAIALHWAMIEGENDSAATVEAIKEAVGERGIRAKFNLVRYNPYSERQGRESPEPVLFARFEVLKNAMSSATTRIVPRVGFDVQASCGMFVHPAESGQE
jgi:23S rRNA (adenine2503-C2)-methyltransferase